MPKAYLFCMELKTINKESALGIKQLCKESLVWGLHLENALSQGTVSPIQHLRPFRFQKALHVPVIPLSLEDANREVGTLSSSCH